MTLTAKTFKKEKDMKGYALTENKHQVIVTMKEKFFLEFSLFSSRFNKIENLLFFYVIS